MKKIIKNILNKIIDLIFLPFELIYNFIKNADNIIYTIIRLILLLFLITIIIFTIIAKPYNKLSKNFYFEKYSNGDEAKTSITTLMPIKNNNINNYINYFEKIGCNCEEKSDSKSKFYDCFYNENLILTKYKWGVFIRFDNNNNITFIDISKTKQDNFFKTIYKKIILTIKNIKNN